MVARDHEAVTTRCSNPVAMEQGGYP
jgi:hypothetical protein